MEKIKDFNPRSHERSDSSSSSAFFIALDFNPRSHERSDKDTDRLVDEFMNFNPRSHERSDSYALAAHAFTFISIHAPTRGATYDSAASSTSSQISIHAPTRGATFSVSAGRAPA